MKKFIDFCILFTLYVYKEYIKEDWRFITKLGKIYYYPFWFVRSCLIWLICPIFIPEYFLKQSDLYKQILKIQNSPEYKAQILKSMGMFRF